MIQDEKWEKYFLINNTISDSTTAEFNKNTMIAYFYFEINYYGS